MIWGIISIVVVGIALGIVAFVQHKNYKAYVRHAYLCQENWPTRYKICKCDYNQAATILKNNPKRFDTRGITVSGFKWEYEHFIMDRPDGSDIILVLKSHKDLKKFIKYYQNRNARETELEENAILANLLADSLENACKEKSDAERHLEKAVERVQELINR